MTEKVLPLPLSGEEIRLAILDKISNSLKKDCFLSPNLAYDFYDAHVTVSLRAHDVGRIAEVKVEEQVTAGENPDEFLEAADAEFDVDAQAPNEVRVETGQPVPVLTHDKEGHSEIRPVRYSRKALQKK